MNARTSPFVIILYTSSPGFQTVREELRSLTDLNIVDEFEIISTEEEVIDKILALSSRRKAGA